MMTYSKDDGRRVSLHFEAMLADHKKLGAMLLERLDEVHYRYVAESNELPRRPLRIVQPSPASDIRRHPDLQGHGPLPLPARTYTGPRLSPPTKRRSGPAAGCVFPRTGAR